MIEIADINGILQHWRKSYSETVTLDSEVADGSVLGQIVTVSDVSDFDRTKHSLEAQARHSRDDTNVGAELLSLSTTFTGSGVFTSWYQVTPSLAADLYLAWIDIWGWPPTSNQRAVVEVGIGAASSETTILRKSFFEADGINEFVHVQLFPRRLIASGTRVSVRGSTSGADTSHRVYLNFMNYP